MRTLLRFITFIVVVMAFAVLPVAAQESRAALNLITPNAPVGLDSEFNVLIQVEAGGLPVDAAAAYLNFDPAVFQVVRVQPGTSLPIFLQSEMDNVAGTVNFAAGQFPSAYPTGSFTLATVTLRAIAESDAALISLSFDSRRQTDVVFAGQSVMAEAVGAMVMITKDAAPAIENVTAPVITEGTGQIGNAAIIQLPGADVVPGISTLAPVAPPYAANLSDPSFWVAEGAWAQAVAADGSTAWSLNSASSASALRLAQPIDLNGLASANVALSYTSGVQGQIELMVEGNGVWLPIAFVNPSAELASVVVALDSYVGRVVHLRFVSTAAAEGSVAGASWTIDALSITGNMISLDRGAETEIITPEGDGAVETGTN